MTQNCQPRGWAWEEIRIIPKSTMEIQSGNHEFTVKIRLNWWRDDERRGRFVHRELLHDYLRNESMDWIFQQTATRRLYSIQSDTTICLSDDDEYDDVLSVQLRVILGTRRCTQRLSRCAVSARRTYLRGKQHVKWTHWRCGWSVDEQTHMW